MSSTVSTSTLTPLVATDVGRTFGDRAVLDGVDLTVSPGQRVGLIGENGTGKSTLLRLLAGVDRPDTGSITRPDDLAYLPQEPPFDDGATVAHVLAEALAPLHRTVRDVERLGELIARDPLDERTASAYAAALARAEAQDAWDADRRAREAADRLGLRGLDDDRLVGTLSGGQRTRLAAAVVVTRRPACLLLDEPTNHLDDDAMELVEDTCRSLPGVVVVASHDRVLLDRVCTHLVDLDPAALGTDGEGGRRFGGGFTDYLGHRAAARLRWEERYAEQQAEIARLRDATRIDTSAVAHGRGPTDNDKFITRFKGARVDRTVARRVRDAEQRLEVAEREQVRRPPAPLRLRADLTGRPGGSALAVGVRDLAVRHRLAVASLDVPTGGRLLVTGANGSGKSTLLAVLDGRLRPDSGTVQVSARRVATLRQDVTFDDDARTASQAYRHALGPELSASVPLRDLGLLAPASHATPVGDLSVGQRRRLALALLVARSPDLLLLDEPTNHLSPTLATELEEALRETPGTVVVASHDRWLRRRWDGPELRLQPAG
ncbi:ABC-F family ATP-binding cassette domain-containing protein [Solicola sp. PLA-1-18]|uniref:ABC-F family ATP-binding cassette domain-containing protein n=1 Tax=Solicola sp. PLA-1-18 TaxID=3380532 RepID=UPI003B7CC6B4